MGTNSEGDQLGGTGQILRCTFFGHATPDRAGARPYHVQCRVTRCDTGPNLHRSIEKVGNSGLDSILTPS